MPISDVSEKGNWIVVFDDNNKEIKRMGSSNKEVVGVTSDFFVVLDGNWIVTYDEKCKEIKRMGASKKTVKGASGRTFYGYRRQLDRYLRSKLQREGPQRALAM